MSTPAPLRVLVIDDDVGIRRLLTILFEREGWSVTAAADGEDGATQITSSNPDVVVLDLMMPKRDGLDLIKQMNAEDPARLRAIVVLTAVSEAQLRRLPENLGVWQIIRKPFDNQAILQSVRACGDRFRSLSS
jgi:DNA-binding response OmpR family regulator